MSTAEINQAVARLSRRRYGVIYARELEEHLTTAQMRTCTRIDLLERRFPLVYINPAVARTPEQDLAAAIGAAGAARGLLAAAGHRSAVAMWDVIAAHPAAPEVVIPLDRRVRPRGVVVRRSTDLCGDDLVMHRRLLVPNPILAVFLYAAVEGPVPVAEAIVRAARQRRFRPKAVENMLERRGRSGCDGIACVRAALDSLPVGARPADSVIELWFHMVARRFAVPELVFQLKVVIEGRRFLIDFAHPGVKLAIEIDDYETHGTLCGFVHDRQRRNLLVLDGWTVLQFTWRQLRYEPELVARQVLRALGDLGIAA